MKTPLILPLLILSLVGLVACGKSSGAAPQPSSDSTEEGASSPARELTLRDRILKNAWCIEYWGIDPTQPLRDTYVQERTQYMSSGILRIDRFEVRTDGSLERIKSLAAAGQKWELENDTLTTISGKGKIDIGTVSFDPKTPNKMRIIWVTGDPGLLYHECK